MNANGIVAGVASLTNIAGPVLGGVLYGVIGINAIIVISCVSFFLSAIMEIFIQIPFIKQEQNSNIIKTIFTDIKDGIVHICKENRFILKILFSYSNKLIFKLYVNSWYPLYSKNHYGS